MKSIPSLRGHALPLLLPGLLLSANAFSLPARGEEGPPRRGEGLSKLEAPVSIVAKGGVTPSIAVDSAGGIYVTFFDEKTRDFLLATSTDGGKSFSAPVVAISTGGRGEAGMQRGPRVGVDEKKRIFVSACLDLSGPPEGRRRIDVGLAVSTDGGRTFGKPVRVNDVPGSAPEAYNALAVSPEGFAHLAWLDLRRAPDLKQLVYSARATLSPQGELVVGRNVEVYVSPGKTVCECCNVGIAVDGRGNPAIAFRNSLPDGSRDAFLTASRDGGGSFQPAVKVGRGSWKAG